jgi:general transcription factor 3C polypeptide 3 (transcription factor C subunit 4)
MATGLSTALQPTSENYRPPVSSHTRETQHSSVSQDQRKSVSSTQPQASSQPTRPPGVAHPLQQPFSATQQSEYGQPSQGEQREDDDGNGKDIEDDIGDDPLLSMQNNLSTFEDSVRSFVGAGTEKSLFAEFRDKPLRPRRTVKRGPRKAAEPTGDVKLRLSAASDAFTRGRLDEALDYVHDAIRINGEINRAWTLLATILSERKEYKQSLLAMVCAAHLQPKIFESWNECGKFALWLMEECPDDAEDTCQIAILVFSQAIKIQPEHTGVRQTRAALYLSRGSYRQAYNEYAFMIERAPHDVFILRGLADTAVQYAESSRKASGEKQRENARDAYRRCIAHFQAEHPAGAANPELPFEWDDAFIYIALLTHLEQYEEALQETRSLSRWLLGRMEETFWDEQQDDREWDRNEERRKEVPEFVSGKNPSSSYGPGLPLRLRISLAIYRLRLDLETDDEATVRTALLQCTISLKLLTFSSNT